MTSVDAAKSWTAFWEFGHGAMCLPGSRSAHERLGQIWQSAARDLPPQARVLDLACGSGVVCYLLRQQRPDVSVVGVDYARIGPSRMPGVELLAGVSLEQLPFDGGCFDGAVSQFGIEYADRPCAVREVSRVLRSGSPITLVMHHAGSPVVQHNQRRVLALLELTGQAVERAFLEADRPAFEREFALLRSSFADQDVVQEFERGLSSALTQPAADRSALWRDVTSKVDLERRILAALASAAVTDCQPWLDELSGNFAMKPAETVAETDGLPLAWLLWGKRT